MTDINEYVDKIIVGDCRDVMSNMPENSIDQIVTSCPYGVGIDYDSWDDDEYFDEYMKFTSEWLSESYRVLKDDGRIALNIPYEINRQDKGGRIFFSAEVWMLMKKIGFKFFGIVDLEESSPHRSKTTAWGSWMSPSSPYIYNPKECIILAYKNKHKKTIKGIPQWKGEQVQIENEDGSVRNKMIYNENDKKEFMNLVYGQWDYFADTKQLTKATFSVDIPDNAIKILTYKNDIVLDPFCGSGTTCLSADKLGRRFIGIDISEKYCKIARERVFTLREQRKQLELSLKKSTE